MNDDRIISVPIHTVKPHPRNEEFYDNADPESFQRLKDSIAEVGMLTPIRISKNYTIISGHQRYRACQELGVDFIQVVIDNELEDESEMLMQLIVSNFGRMKNDPIKQGAMIAEYEKLRGVQHGGDHTTKASADNARLLQADIAKEFGCDVSTLRRLKQLAKMPPEIQEIVRSGKLSPTTAVKVIAPLPLEDQLKLIQSLPEASKRLTQAAVQAEVSKLRDTAIAAEREKEAAEQANTRAAEIVAEAEMAKEAMLDELSYAKEVADSLRQQLSDAQAQLAQKPQEITVTPADYDELKTKAKKVEELERQLAKYSAPVEATEEPLACMQSSSYVALFMDCLPTLKLFVKDILNNPGLVNEFSDSFRQDIANAFPNIAHDLIKIADYCATLSTEPVTPSAGIRF